MQAGGAPSTSPTPETSVLGVKVQKPGSTTPRRMTPRSSRPGVSPQVSPARASGSGSLAKTGADILGVSAVGLAATAAGAALLRKARTSDDLPVADETGPDL